MYNLPYITLREQTPARQNAEVTRYLRQLVNELNSALNTLETRTASGTETSEDTAPADTIMRVKTKDGWHIVQYASGRAELYGTHTAASQTFTAPSGDWYYNDTAVSVPLTLKEFWCGTATHVTGTKHLCKVLWDDTNNRAIVRTISDTGAQITNAEIKIHIIGTWK
jgi:hypothetical protein